MTNWNPNAPKTLGVEWMPDTSRIYALDSVTKMAASSFVQTTSQAIGSIRVPNYALPVRGGIYAVEAYDNETAVGANFTTLTAVPNEDVSGTGTTGGQWRTQASGTSTIYTTIDETTLSTADYIHNGGGAANARYTSRFNTGSLSLTGKRILAVELVAQVGRYTPDNNTQVVLGLNLSSTDYWETFTVPYAAGPYQKSIRWTYNPSTKKPWTIAEVQALDTTDEWFVNGSSTPDGGVYVYQVLLKVYIVDENRIAVGILDDSASGLTAGSGGTPAWNSATMLTPTGGTWTKDGSGSHLITVRRLNDTGSMQINQLARSDGATPSIANGWNPTVDSTYGYVTAMGSASAYITPLVLVTTAPADSVDSLSYAVHNPSYVNASQTVEQEYTPGASASYGIFQFYVARNAAATDLIVKIKRRSDNVQFGATFTLSTSDYDSYPDAAGGYKLVTSPQVTAGALVSGTQYYVEFSTGDSSSIVGWQVLGVDTVNQGNSATFGGTTDRAKLDGSEADRNELLALISTIPTAPANFALALVSNASEPGAAVGGCDTIYSLESSWDATALGADFAYYELQRSEDSQTTWTTIGRLTDENAEQFDDFEARRGWATDYRLRVVRTDGAFSDWTSIESGVTPASCDCPTLHFVSNYDASYNTMFDWRPERSFTFNEDDERVLRAVYGRDYQLGFIPTEYRGTTLSATLIIGAGTASPTGASNFGAAPANGRLGRDAFDVLRALARAPLPYVCVLDHESNRYYAMLRVPSGTQVEPEGRYLADIKITEVTPDPYVVSEPPSGGISAWV